MEAFVIFFIFVAIVLVILSAARTGRRLAARTSEMRQLAESLGFQLTTGPSTDIIRECENYFPLLKGGDWPRARNIMSGEYQGVQFTYFDFHYTTQESILLSKRTYTKKHLVSVSLIELPRGFPGLAITPEYMPGSKRRRSWTRDIDFESYEFSEHFDVRSEDKKFAYDFCNPRMMEFLLTHKNLTLQIGSKYMLLLPQGWIKEGDKLADPDRIRSCLSALAEVYSQIYSHIPNFLIEEDLIEEDRRVTPKPPEAKITSTSYRILWNASIVVLVVAPLVYWIDLEPLPELTPDGVAIEPMSTWQIDEIDGLAYFKGRQRLFSGTLVHRNAEGLLYAEIHYLNGKKDGAETEWYENGQKRSEKHYINGLYEGVQTEWYENGQNRFQGHCDYGYCEGVRTEWHENGQKASEQTTVNTRLDGGIASEQNTVDWRADGVHTEWHENGQKASEEKVGNRGVEGTFTFWHENGQKQLEGRVGHNRYMVGTINAWYESGQQSRKMTVSGNSSAFVTEWYENGQKRSEGFFDTQFIYGHKEFHKYGRQAFEDRYAWGRDVTEWDENGQKKN